jgi:hypothetical protein
MGGIQYLYALFFRNSLVIKAVRLSKSGSSFPFFRERRQEGERASGADSFGSPSPPAAARAQAWRENRGFRGRLVCTFYRLDLG